MSQQLLPQEEGFYLWYILDLNYINVGLVQIMIDDSKHLAYLADNPGPMFYVYERNEPLTKELGLLPLKFTMYHQAHNNLPPVKNGCPMVDGWIPFDLRWVNHYRKFDSIKLIPNLLPKIH